MPRTDDSEIIEKKEKSKMVSILIAVGLPLYITICGWIAGRLDRDELTEEQECSTRIP